MNSKTRLSIAGVPEHFNLPWHLAIEKKKFLKKGIDLIWKDYYGGTGAMCEALRNKETDMALVLTEGAFKELANDSHSKIVKIYVESPLLWGIHVGVNSTLKAKEDLENATIAISRMGSGSHLMAKVNAYQQHWNQDNLHYKTIKNIEGGIAEISKDKNAYFLWEHFTTKPYVEANKAKEIGTIKTPWPCFVLLVRKDVLNKHRKDIKKVIKIINKQIKKTENKKENLELIRLFANRYTQNEEDIKEWLSITKWNAKKSISKNKFQEIQDNLLQFKVIEKPFNYADVVCNVFKRN